MSSWSTKSLPRFWPAALALLICGSVSADQLKFARLHLSRVAAPDMYELRVRVPVIVTGEGEISLPQQCAEISRSAQPLGTETTIAIRFQCGEGLRAGDKLVVPWGEDGGVFTSALQVGPRASIMLHGDEGGLVLPLDAEPARSRPLPTVAIEYTGLGIIHILEGFDHLAFVLCLCMLMGGSTLLWLVTAFTLGHSLSLALSFLGVVSIPVPPVEATIALSIAFMAREALRTRRSAQSESSSLLRYLAVVASFGLLHGLGFASVLSELGVVPAERVTGLIFFNIGVEIGQLIFVAVVSAVVVLVRRHNFAVPLRTTMLYAVGTLGMFWTCERVAGFLA
jgi:hypothetical protein